MRRFPLNLPALLVLLWPLTSGAAAPLRFCADPGSLPLSSSNPATPGIYIELGQKIAAALGRPFEPVWAPTEVGAREIRQTVLAGKCDGFLGVPDDPAFMPSLIVSKPLLTFGYALVAPRGVAVRSFADLSGKRVAVQFATPPQDLLAEHDDITMVTVNAPREGMQALADRAADVAILWGPSAGWINHEQMHDAYHVAPLAGDGMRWRAAIGFARHRTALRDAVDAALGRLGGTIRTLEVQYGFPQAAPIRLVQAAAKDLPAVPPPAAASHNARTAIASKDIAAGHQLFNDNCEHCHGPDAITGIEVRNLRHLKDRYGGKMNRVFFYTVTHGRPAKGMPNWSGILSHEQFEKILAWLHTIQDK